MLASKVGSGVPPRVAVGSGVGVVGTAVMASGVGVLAVAVLAAVVACASSGESGAAVIIGP